MAEHSHTTVIALSLGLTFAGLERIRDLSSSSEALRSLERVTALHQRALKASKDLDAIEVSPQVLTLYVSRCWLQILW